MQLSFHTHFQLEQRIKYAACNQQMADLNPGGDRHFAKINKYNTKNGVSKLLSKKTKTSNRIQQQHVWLIQFIKPSTKELCHLKLHSYRNLQLNQKHSTKPHMFNTRQSCIYIFQWATFLTHMVHVVVQHHYSIIQFA